MDEQDNGGEEDNDSVRVLGYLSVRLLLLTSLVALAHNLLIRMHCCNAAGCFDFPQIWNFPRNSHIVFGNTDRRLCSEAPWSVIILSPMTS
jgi:hypothetical protein